MVGRSLLGKKVAWEKIWDEDLGGGWDDGWDEG